MYGLIFFLFITLVSKHCGCSSVFIDLSVFLEFGFC
ncbi:hypothetical protein GLYMA_05G061066v4 [Glycine max]|nr:hypothetical protein GLYMA_05G061066v4 [Glycine max]KAH1133046.1 hypothetical protein GYH30_011744 [Glycine max]